MKKQSGALLMLALFMVFSCQQTTQQEKAYFDCKSHFEKVIEALHSAGSVLQKTVWSDGRSETVIIHTPDWKKELAPFMELDINKPALRGMYDVRVEDRDSEIVTEYLSKDLNNPVSYLLVAQNRQEKVARIKAICSTQNPYHASSDTLVFESSGVYHIKAYSNPTLGKRIAFDVSGKILQK
ncbi:MAG: hypothetical protein ACO3O0_03550 [Bacteroidia bacterium]